MGLKKTPNAASHPADWRRALRALAPLVLFLACVALSGGCTCTVDSAPPRGVLACRPQHPTRATVPAAAPEVETVAAGTVPVSFSVTSGGGAALLMAFRPVPGGALVPEVGLTYSSGGGDGIVGAGFSLSTGTSSVNRCPKNLAEDGEIREVRFDAFDKLCLGGRSLLVVGKEPGLIEYRTLPDTHVRVIGHDPDDEGMPR